MNDDQSEMVSCPFNSAHTIERRRLQAHIIKCKRVNNNFFFLRFECYIKSFFHDTGSARKSRLCSMTLLGFALRKEARTSGS